MRRRIVTALTLTAILAACSSGGSGDSSETTAATSDPPASTTSTTSSTASSTTSTVASAPTTTLDPTTELKAAIERDLNAGEQALLAAGADPTNPALRAALERYYSGSSLDVAIGFLDQLVADGSLVRPSPDQESRLVVVSLDGSSGAPPAEAEITLCRIDAGVVYQPLPNGAEAIVNDAIYNTVSSNTIALVDGTWRLDGGTTVREQQGVTTCDP